MTNEKITKKWLLTLPCIKYRNIEEQIENKRKMRLVVNNMCYAQAALYYLEKIKGVWALKNTYCHDWVVEEYLETQKDVIEMLIVNECLDRSCLRKYKIEEVQDPLF